MAWLNASGNPVAIQSTGFQINLPTDEVGDKVTTSFAVNWGAVMGAFIQLVLALMTGNSAAIQTAIQALINAFMGKAGWFSASGSPVTITLTLVQFDLPSEAVGDTEASMAAVNWGKVLAAGIQLVIAMMTGNPTAIAAAIQALINAFMGG
jgi:hypothetical protein